MIPLGGFVKITGMNPEELEAAEAAPGGAAAGRPELAAATDAGRDTPEGLLERIESAGQTRATSTDFPGGAQRAPTTTSRSGSGSW